MISLKKPELTNAANVLGTLNLLKAAADNHVQRFVFASSAAIYGNTNVMKISEAAPLRPISPYGVSKLAAEKYCEVYHTIHGLSTVSLRYFNVYGQRQRADNPYSGVIAIFARKLMAGRRTTITGNGLQSRDFVHVSDVVNSNLLALTTEKGVGKELQHWHRTSNIYQAPTQHPRTSSGNKVKGHICPGQSRRHQ